MLFRTLGETAEIAFTITQWIRFFPPRLKILIIIQFKKQKCIIVFFFETGHITLASRVCGSNLNAFTKNGTGRMPFIIPSSMNM